MAMQQVEFSLPRGRSLSFRLALPLVIAAALAGCQTDQTASRSAAAATAPAPARPAASGAISEHEASARCWMKYERGRRDLPLDTRAGLVEKCIAEKMGQAGR